MGRKRTENLPRRAQADLDLVPPFKQLSYARCEDPHSIINAMRDHSAMLDAIRDGMINKAKADAPTDIVERANHLKAFGYFSDASLVGAARLSPEFMLPKPYRNPDIDRLAHELRTRQTKTLASGIDLIMADLKESMEAPPSTIDTHTHALVFLYEDPREIAVDEPGTDWIRGAAKHRSSLLAAETAVVIANYLRILGHDARAHTASSTDVDLNRLAVQAGIAVTENGDLFAPFIGTGFGLAAVTTDFAIAVDKPLGPLPAAAKRTKPAYTGRQFKDGAHPFETLKRCDKPTTFIDEPRVPRVPKRTDMFSRALFGDMGKPVQDGAKNGHYVRKAPTSTAQRRALGGVCFAARWCFRP